MQDKNNTQFFKVEKEQQIRVDDVLEIVYRALREKGYNPVNQIVGYIMSGDPTYITSHNNARRAFPLRVIHILRESQYNPVHLVFLNQRINSRQSLSQLSLGFPGDCLNSLRCHKQFVAYCDSGFLLRKAYAEKTAKPMWIRLRL